jgi:DNA helicase IV
VQTVLDGVHARGLPLRGGREQLQRRLSVLAVNRFTELRPSVDESDVTAALREGKELTAAVQRLWPVPSAPVLVRRLLGNRRALAAAAAGLLDPGEQTLLHRKAAAKQAEERWTRADLALLDEAESVVGGPPRTFGHVVVDEAQDHSAMELRMLGRRSPSRSMTILGDLAQATGTGAQSRWDDALGSLGAADGRVAELELGYRVPAPVLELANRLLPFAAPGVRPSRSVRATGAPPSVERCATPEEMPAAVIVAVSGARRHERSVGVVAPDAHLDAIADALRAGAVDFADGRKVAGLSDAVTLVPPASAKGLEFDSVIVVEPAEIAAIGEHGLRLLYIALTRAVRTLTLVHAADLPAPLH